ncbi:hypothetical protein [Paenibacillus amylolyticus]|nr:hypothetical protein [Paenibacillus amylolyticus]
MLVVEYREQDHDKLVEIWESSVRATHWLTKGYNDHEEECAG